MSFLSFSFLDYEVFIMVDKYKLHLAMLVRHKRSMLFFFMVSFTIFLHGQVVSVINSSTGMPVPNTGIFNKKGTTSAITNDKGQAPLAQFSKGDSIYFQHPSYNRYATTLNQIAKANYIVYLRKKNVILEEFVISASKSLESKREVAHQIDVLQPAELKITTFTNSADLLRKTGHVAIQKSQGGGGSPILRGFEANKILLVVDGVRMNNAIYRSGHLQNSITVDDRSLERVEVTFGPNSLIYGSDALGGVIHYYTVDPMLADTVPFIVNGSAGAGFSTADMSKNLYVNLNTGGKKVANVFSFSYDDYGNITMGSNRSPFIGDYGRLYHYVERVNNRDTVIKNDNPNVQLNTGYQQYDFLNKLKFSPGRALDIILNLQYSTSSSIDRFDQLSNFNGGIPNYAEWYYGPQNRFLSALKIVVRKDNFLFTNFSSILAFQSIDENRITRRFRNEDRLHQEEDVNVYSLNFDFFKVTQRNNRINYGLEAIYNQVESGAYYYNLSTQALTAAQTRYPAGGSYSFSTGAYLTYKYFLEESFTFLGGARYSFNRYYSDLNNQFIALPFSSVEINNGALTGSLSAIYHPEDDFKLSLIGSSGFRNPNVDDYGKIRAKDGLVTVPSDNIEPEYTYNLELSFSKTYDGYIKISGGVYATWLTNAIVRQNYEYMGQDSLWYDGELYQMITNKNADRAVIRGAYLNLLSDLNTNISFKSTLNYTYGKDLSNNVPMAHIPPVFGRTTISYKAKRVFYQMYGEYNAWKRMEDMSPFGEDNAEEATEYGFPGWYTLNTKAVWTITPDIQLNFAIENILDTYYKPFASGISAPGRSFIIMFQYSI